MTQNHDTDARLEMLRETIDRNRDKVSERHEFEQRDTAVAEKQKAKAR